jgi:hypothetical protein
MGPGATSECQNSRTAGPPARAVQVLHRRRGRIIPAATSPQPSGRSNGRPEATSKKDHPPQIASSLAPPTRTSNDERDIGPSLFQVPFLSASRPTLPLTRSAVGPGRQFGSLSDRCFSALAISQILHSAASNAQCHICTYPDDVLFSISVEDIYHFSSSRSCFGLRHAAAPSRAFLGLYLHLSEHIGSSPAFIDDPDYRP